MKQSRSDIFVIGFALFSMFFGAGNVIFPPYLGLQSGSHWFLGFLCYYLADIGLALLALFAILRSGGPEGIIRPLGRIPSTVLMCSIVLCIGPLLAIPRTAASTYEMSVAPLVSGFNPILFSALFFLLIFLMCLRESAVVDIVGKVLTPALFLGLLVLIVCGVVNPIGPVPNTVPSPNVPALGIQAGYQTMDVLATLLFGILILKSARDKGHTSQKAQFRAVAGAGVVAGTGLLVVYCGLTYLGVTTSRFFDLSVNRTYLVVSIVRNLLGNWGTVLFAVVVALACITTAAALVSSAADYFSTLSGGRLPYGWAVGLMCVFSTVVSSFGLDQIIAVAGPVLDVVYPPTLTLLLLSFLRTRIPSDWVYRLGALGALGASLLTVARTFGAPFDFLDALPLSDLGFGWMLPAALCAAVGFLLPRKQ